MCLKGLKMRWGEGGMLGVLLDLEFFRCGLHPDSAIQQLYDFGKSLNSLNLYLLINKMEV